LKTKDKAKEKLIALIKYAEVEIGKQVNYFQSNGGGEYSSGQFAKYLKSKGIHHEFTNPNIIRQECGQTLARVRVSQT